MAWFQSMHPPQYADKGEDGPEDAEQAEKRCGRNAHIESDLRKDFSGLRGPPFVDRIQLYLAEDQPRDAQQRTTGAERDDAQDHGGNRTAARARRHRRIIPGVAALIALIRLIGRWRLLAA